jgi:phosphoenolpyruvate carboxylase
MRRLDAELNATIGKPLPPNVALVKFASWMG